MTALWTLRGVVFRYCDINLVETRPVVDIVCLTNTACGVVAGKSNYNSNYDSNISLDLCVFDLLADLETRKITPFVYISDMLTSQNNGRQ